MRELFEQFGSLRKDFFLKLQEALDDLFTSFPLRLNMNEISWRNGSMDFTFAGKSFRFARACFCP